MPCPETEHVETFWTLLRDAAHWEFELFLMLLFDGVIGLLLWPFIRKHWKHHVRRDHKEGVDKPGAGEVARGLLYLCECCIAAEDRRVTFTLAQAFLRPIRGSNIKAYVCCPRCHIHVVKGPLIVRGTINLKKIGAHLESRD